MDEMTKQMIYEIYEKNFRKIGTGTLFGEPVDINDPKCVAVAFYFIAETETRKEAQGHFDTLANLCLS